jgi:hypothetical protein
MDPRSAENVVKPTKALALSWRGQVKTAADFHKASIFVAPIER